MPEARLSCSPMTNKPRDEGTNTVTRGYRGSGEGTEGSHLQNHNRVISGMGPGALPKPELDTKKNPSTVMLPSTGSFVLMLETHLII